MSQPVQRPIDRNAIDPIAIETARTERKTYTTPTLTDFGSVAEITQGTFAGVGPDSGIYS